MYLGREKAINKSKHTIMKNKAITNTIRKLNLVVWRMTAEIATKKKQHNLTKNKIIQ